MKVSVLSDSNWEAKLDHAMRPLSLRKFFEARDYGHGVLAICIVVNARDPGLGHRRRECFTKADGTLSFDVMLPLETLIKATHQQRRNLVCEGVCNELESTLRRRLFSGFDAASFLSDFAQVIREDLQGDAASRFDHLCRERS